MDKDKKLYRAVTQMSPVKYKTFYKLYYRERLKTFRVIATIVAVISFAAAFFAYYRGLHLVWTALGLWIGLFCLVYPSVAYRRPYKKVKDTKQTTRFAFYEDCVEEKTNGEESRYEYSKLLRVMETSKYIFIYHTIESVSIVEKDEVREGADGLCALLRSKVGKYKKVK